MILIIDDNEDICRILKRSFTNAGIDCMALSDPSHASDFVSSFRPNVLILDYQMPEKSGLDVLAELREANLLTGIAVVVYSAHHDIERAALGAGATRCIQKDCRVGQFREDILDLHAAQLASAKDVT